MGVFDRDFTGNIPVILANKMKFDVLPQFFYGKFAGFTTPKGQAVTSTVTPRPTTSPVVIQHELERRAGDLIQIPIHRLLTQLPTVGRDQLAGHEERPFINHASVPIDVVRHAELPQDGIMSRQTTKEYRILENTRPALLRHYAMVNEFLGAAYAMYYGFSWNILNSVRFAGDAKIKAVSHPHIFVAGSGKVGYGSGYPGSDGYETAVGTAISAIGTADVFDTSLLSALKAHQQIQRIQPIITKQGNPLRLIAAHPYQIATLEADSLFQSTTASVYAQQLARDNPLLVGAKYVWGGFAIFETDTAVWPVRVSGGKPQWGPASITDMTSFRAYESDTIFAAVVFGQNALFKAMGESIQYKKRVDDYDEIIGIAYRAVEGYARGDYWNEDDGSRGQYLINDGSALVVTYAAAPTM